MNIAKEQYYSLVKEAREVYENSGNIAAYLRTKLNLKENTPEIIEIAYDLQAGSYIDAIKESPIRYQKYCSELASYIAQYVDPQTSLLEIGCGEATNTLGIVQKIPQEIKHIIGFDISLSRIQVALKFWESEFLKNNNNLAWKSIEKTFFVADLFNIPLASHSVDVVYTSHSIEPNGGREVEALQSIFRVAKKRVLLFEPYFEKASQEGQERMSSHGYIKRIPEAIIEAGGIIHDIRKIENIGNPLNPTYLFDIEISSDLDIEPSAFWIDPITNDILEYQGDCYYCSNSGLAYPIIKGIPCLRPENSIVATHLLNQC